MAGTKPKRAPGESPALSFLLAGGKALVVIITILTVLIVGWSTWRWYRPEFFFNPINRFVHVKFLECRDGGRCPVNGSWRDPMVPEVFAVGEPRDQVVQRLLEAGYKEWVIDQNEENYALRGAGNIGLLCSMSYVVRVTFDRSHRLTTAESTSHGVEGCL